MKTLLLFLGVVSLFVGCNTSQKISSANAPKQELSVEASDSTEYELLVFDPRFDTFLATQPYPKNFYSDTYYKNWNERYCIEWNIRHSNPLRFGDFYETAIPYDGTVDYGIDFNFKLYQYFQFIEQEYGITLIRRRGR